MKIMKGRLLIGIKVLLTIYIFFIFYITVISRESSNENFIKTELAWGYKTISDIYANSENLWNILLFVPIGCLGGLATTKYSLIKAVLLGLFVSESIECIQLIWKKGVFDVDDLMNNTIGALIGGLIAIAVTNGTQRLKAAKDKLHSPA